MEKNKNTNNEETELDINHLMQIRREKLKELQEQGKDPFEITKFNRTNTAGEKMTNTEKEYTMEELVQLINSQENDFIIEISLEGDDE